MFEYHNHLLCVQGGWLYGAAQVITKSTYDNLQKRGWLKVARRGGNGRPALVEWDSLRSDVRAKVVELVGCDPHKLIKRNHFEEYLESDPEAATYFSEYTYNGDQRLPEKNQREYRVNAEILNAIHVLVKSRTARARALGGSATKIWEDMANLLRQLDKNTFPHSLPINHRSLKRKYKSYAKNGYHALIHGNFGNANSRKVDYQLENLLLSLYCLPTKPYATEVHNLYYQFIGDALDVVDIKTGELFDPRDFYDAKGQPLVVSESTVWNYLNEPKNRVMVDKFRAGSLEFNNTHRPHHNRHKPQYSLSKVSMDDRDLPRKMSDGKRVKSYLAYDVTSGVVIGAAYSKRKDSHLFIDCMRNMFRFLRNNETGIPLEVEVEHHLVSGFKDGLMKAGHVFPFIRWGNPGNAQEKHAEHFHKRKKYGYEKKYQEGIGRFYAKLEANRTHQDKISDEENTNYKEAFYSFEQLVADDKEIIELYNNDLHRDQEKYPGMTRMEVFLEELNPQLARYDESLLAQYIGDRTSTTIRRSQYVHVQNAKYQLPSARKLERLAPNNYQVEAYYIPAKDGSIPKVYLYQNDSYICECKKLETYNTARGEWSEDDIRVYQEHSKYVGDFDGMVKTRKKDLPRVRVAYRKDEDFDIPEPEIIEELDQENPNEFDELLTGYDTEEIRNRATDSL